MAKRQRSIVVKPTARKGSIAFEAVTAVLAFAAAYFILVSGLGNAPFRLLAVVPGIAVAALGAVFANKKWANLIILGGVVVFTVLCIVVSIKTFTGGAVNFYNAICNAVNANMNRGFSTVSNGGNGWGDFLFSSVISVWMAVVITVVVGKWRMPIIVAYAVLVLGLIAFGVYPKIYSVVLVALAVLCLLLYDKDFSISLVLKCLVATVVIFAAVTPCFFYKGSDALKDAHDDIIYAAETVAYGSDNLPEGRLNRSYGMRDSTEERLVVTIDDEIPNLYLKGYVGTDFDGRKWISPDRNSYVEQGYKGILNYLKQSGIPSVQYAKYATLGNNNDRFNVEVKNVGAKKKYVYSPYTMESYSAGKEYYDLNLKGKADSYRFTALSRSASSENVTQAEWLLDSEARTQGMNVYITYEGQYRAFVYSNYTEVEEGFASKIKTELSVADRRTINAMTQVIRSYFLNNFEYADYPDKLEGDFYTDFFGGKIKKANSAYFATAATCIFRAYGYPARYAEGYFLYYDMLKPGSPVSVTDRNVHAWTEVYFDGIGWLPIETTVGYFDRDGGTATSPDGTETPETPVKPPEPPEEIEQPEPPVDPEIEATRQQQALIRKRIKLALAISMPIVGFALIVAAFIVTVILRRKSKHRKKRERLLLHGEEYGRSVYFIMMHDTKPIGGFTEEKLEEYGVAIEKTRALMTIIEKSVYGLYEIGEEDRQFVESFINEIDKIVLASMAKKNKLLYLKVKYLDCIG